MRIYRTRFKQVIRLRRHSIHELKTVQCSRILKLLRNSPAFQCDGRQLSWNSSPATISTNHEMARIIQKHSSTAVPAESQGAVMRLWALTECDLPFTVAMRSCNWRFAVGSNAKATMQGCNVHKNTKTNVFDAWRGWEFRPAFWTSA